MSTERKGLELYVGLFLFVGLATIAVMVVVFGRVGEGFQKTYPIVVEFPNASGLIKDSYVLLSGAQIGKVATTPKLTGSKFAVEVTLNIRGNVKLPKKSRFFVGSSGLLGDRFVDVFPPEEFDPGQMIEPGERIKGMRATGLDDLTQKGGEVMDQLNKELQEQSAGRGDVPHGHPGPPHRRRGQRHRADPFRIGRGRPVRGVVDVPGRDGPA